MAEFKGFQFAWLGKKGTDLIFGFDPSPEELVQAWGYVLYAQLDRFYLVYYPQGVDAAPKWAARLDKKHGRQVQRELHQVARDQYSPWPTIESISQEMEKKLEELAKVKIFLYLSNDFKGYLPLIPNTPLRVFPESGVAPKKILEQVDDAIRSERPVAIVTYSSLFLKRIQRRIAETSAQIVSEGLSLKPQDVKIFVVEDYGDGLLVSLKEVVLLPNGWYRLPMRFRLFEEPFFEEDKTWAAQEHIPPEAK